MPDLLLLGAGFSRNWGGWLATEAFEYLLGCHEIISDEGLRQLLWKHQSSGGFEAALAELQLAYARDRQVERSLMELQAAVLRMFEDMNAAFMSLTDWQFGQREKARQIGTFLTRFDAIFTLNQDLLLERHYANDNVRLAGVRGWSGPDLPGMRPLPLSVGQGQTWAHRTWIPKAEADFKVLPSCQPIYKLHGSSNWTHADGKSMLIMGGAKVREIGQTPILNWYAKVFEEQLVEKGSRLMVIGYGFRDDHINKAIAKGVERGLKLFIVAPEGAELAMRLNPTRQPGMIAISTPLEGMLERSLVGASRRPLPNIFSSDDVEFNKVARFFES